MSSTLFSFSYKLGSLNFSSLFYERTIEKELILLYFFFFLISYVLFNILQGKQQSFLWMLVLYAQCLILCLLKYLHFYVFETHIISRILWYEYSNKRFFQVFMDLFQDLIIVGFSPYKIYNSVCCLVTVALSFFFFFSYNMLNSVMHSYRSASVAFYIEIKLLFLQVLLEQMIRTSHQWIVRRHSIVVNLCFKFPYIHITVFYLCLILMSACCMSYSCAD